MRTDDTSTPLDLPGLAAQLVADLPQHPAGRTARTVVAGSVLRAVVIALQEGAEMAEHDAPAGATLYVVSGSVTLRSGDESWRLGPGELLAIPPTRHSVTAHADSAFLLTVARPTP